MSRQPTNQQAAADRFILSYCRSLSLVVCAGGGWYFAVAIAIYGITLVAFGYLGLLAYHYWCSPREKNKHFKYQEGTCGLCMFHI